MPTTVVKEEEKKEDIESRVDETTPEKAEEDAGEKEEDEKVNQGEVIRTHVVENYGLSKNNESTGMERSTLVQNYCGDKRQDTPTLTGAFPGLNEEDTIGARENSNETNTAEGDRNTSSERHSSERNGNRGIRSEGAVLDIPMPAPLPLRRGPAGRRRQGNAQPGAVSVGRNGAAGDVDPVDIDVDEYIENNIMPSSTESHANNSNLGLVEAREVDDDEEAPGSDLGQAREVNPDEIANRAKKREKKFQRHITYVACCLLVVVILVAVAIGAARSDSNKQAPVSAVPTSLPSVSPSEVPTMAPSSGPEEVILLALPQATVVRAQKPDSPQYRALQWLAHHKDNPSTMPVWRIRQLFALASFFYSMRGADDWNLALRNSWMNYDTHECNWADRAEGRFELNIKPYQWIPWENNRTRYAGIHHCNNNSEITSLDLDRFFEYKQITEPPFAVVPPEITLLSSLKVFSIADSYLMGNINDFVPTEVYQMSSLEVFKIWKNFLTGTFPTEMFQMTNLRSFSIGRNHISGTIPTEYGLLTNINTFEILKNRLTGTIPTQIGQLTNVVYTQLCCQEVYGGLTGTIPSQIGNWVNLTEMHMTFGALSGTIPTWIMSLPKLKRLHLRGNFFTGTVPTEMGLATKLNTLGFADNPLTGTLPSELGLLRDNAMVFAWETQITGALPSQLSLLPKLRYLIASDSQLTGQIPTEFGNMTGMQILHLDGNSLSGNLPSELGRCTKSLEILLNDNQFSGQVPSELALLSNLGRLFLQDNAFSSTLPIELGDMPINGSLVDFKLQDNPGITGVVPEGLCLLEQGSYGLGLNFSCEEQLCGCCWCPCEGAVDPNNNASEACPSPYSEEWPGEFPENTTSVAINVRTDQSGWHAHVHWSRQQEGVWELLFLDERLPGSRVNTFTFPVEPSSLYQLRITDAVGNGICCLGTYYGWISVTNSTPSASHANGTVMWDGLGDYRSWMEILISVDSDGNSEIASVEFGGKEKPIYYEGV